MTDRKSLAAGEQVYRESWESDGSPGIPGKQAERPVLQREYLKYSQIVNCKRCGQKKAILEVCKGCPELDKQDCAQCGNKFGKHTFGYGSKKNRRGWVFNDGKIAQVCYPANDPVKQNLDQTGRYSDIF